MLERIVPAERRDTLLLDHYVRYLFASKFVSDKDVLDAACGVGYGSALLKRAGAKRVLGIDVSGEAISQASNRYNQAALSFLQQDLSELQENIVGTFDVIVSFETLEHVTNPMRVLDRLKGLLRSGGVLIVSVPNDIELGVENPFHKTKFTKRIFEAALFDRFKIVKNYYQGFVVGSMIWGERESNSCMSTIVSEANISQLKSALYHHGSNSDDIEKVDCFVAVCSDSDFDAQGAETIVQSRVVWRSNEEMHRTYEGDLSKAVLSLKEQFNAAFEEAQRFRRSWEEQKQYIDVMEGRVRDLERALQQAEKKAK